jgi:hypothetical protein
VQTPGPSPVQRNPIPLPTQDDIDRFWSRVDRSGGPDACWEWQGAQRPTGYGNLWIRGTYQSAHRVAYLIHSSKQPGNLCVCHHCDNPCCVNPRHLFLGTHADNCADMVQKGRSTRRRPRPYASKPGIQNPRAKLTEDQVRAIRAATGTQESIAARFGISRRSVGFIRRREHWKHLL